MNLLRPLAPALCASAIAAGLTGCGQDHESYTDKATDEAVAKWNRLKSGIALEMAESHFNAGQIGLAEKTVADALVVDPEHPKLWLMAGRVALENGELENAYQRLNKSVEYGEDFEQYANADKAQPYYYQGMIDQRWQRYDSAKEKYSTAYGLDGDNVSYLLARAEMMIELDELDQVVGELESNASRFPENATIRALLGHVYRQRGEHEKAALWFKQALMLAPEDHKLREEVARSQLRINRYEEASHTLKALTKTDYGKGRPDLYRLLAEAYTADNKLREARAVYTELTAMDRTSVEDWNKLGGLAYRLGEEGAALQAANKLINLSPDDHRGYLLAGLVWNRRDRLDRALSMFDRAAELAPKDTTPLILRGIALQKNQRPAAAADAYKQALAIDPDDNRAQRLLTSVTENLR